MTHYIRTTRDVLAEGGLAPLDVNHYVMETTTEPSVGPIVRALRYDTGTVGFIGTGAQFAANFAAVAGDDLHAATPTYMQSPNLRWWMLGVDNAGAQEWTPMPTGWSPPA